LTAAHKRQNDAESGNPNRRPIPSVLGNPNGGKERAVSDVPMVGNIWSFWAVPIDAP